MRDLGNLRALKGEFLLILKQKFMIIHCV